MANDAGPGGQSAGASSASSSRERIAGMRVAHGLFIEKRGRESDNAARAEAVWCYCDIWTDLFLDVPA